MQKSKPAFLSVVVLLIFCLLDRCPPEECHPNHLDLSVGAFQALTNGQLDPPGSVEIEWQVLGGGGRGIY